MTSQILISNSLPTANNAADRESHASNVKPFPPSNCQAELRHLQAETEALLQQLQTLKQQRLAATQATN